MATNQIFQYNGSPITFLIGSSLMVNASQMGKSFGKSPKDFLKTEQSKRFIEALSEVKKIHSSDLVRVIYGNGGGTWMHEDVALEFARWLSPVFAIWCNDRIKELLTKGSTTLGNTPDNSSELSDALKRIEALTSQLEETRAEINYMRGRIDAEREIAVLQYRLSIAESGQQNTERIHSNIPICKFGPVSLSGKEIKEEHPDVMLVREVCERMEEENNICIKTNTLFEWLRGNGYLLSGNDCFNRPSDECMRNNWMMYTGRRGTTPEGVKYFTPYFTPKGYNYFSELILKEGGAK